MFYRKEGRDARGFRPSASLLISAHMEKMAARGDYSSHLSRWWDELKEYGEPGHNAPKDPIAHVIHRTARLGGGVVHGITEGLDAVFDDLTETADSGVNINRLPSGAFPRIRRTVGETLDALVHLRPLSFLSKGISLLGKWIPDGYDFLIRNYRSGTRAQLQSALHTSV